MNKNELTGVFHATSKGYGFFTPENSEGADYFVPPRETGNAWDGDTVTLRLSPPGEDGRTAGTVTSVIKRSRTAVTGVLRKHNKEVWLLPDSDKLPSPIRVTGQMHNAHDGDKVAVLMTGYGENGEVPSGTLAETFGAAESLSAAVGAILYNYHVNPEFPEEVLEQAGKTPQEVPEEEKKGRLDLRDKLIITIDGASSRDFDDAVSLERDENGDRVLGVHIADVSHYVTAASPLDKEAWERGTSVYFADRVVPMLPLALSNGICSLNPGVDRLALSCIMTLDGAGNVKSHVVAKSLMRSKERMTYEDCNVLLEGSDPALAERYAQVLPLLRELRTLADQREKFRRQRGALELETSEVVLVCDEEGEPVDVKLRSEGKSESLIEECMLLANETVAKHLSDLKQPCVYRVHEKPAKDKLETLKTAVAPLGYVVGAGDGFALQKVLDAARGKPEGPMVNTLVLRSMMKAKYSDENLGHFGLAADYYCHFTSPIRRYPDLMVHRVLTAVLAGPMDGKAGKKLAGAVQYAAQQSSDREIAAQNAEREIEKCYMAAYMKKHLGEHVTAAVSGVTRFGLFLMLDNGVEGLLSADALPEDDYRYDEGAMKLVGQRNTYSFGQTMEVVVAAAEPAAGRVDFRLPGVPVRVSRLAMRAEAERDRFPGTTPRRQRRETGKKRGGKPAMHVPKRKKGKGKKK